MGLIIKSGKWLTLSKKTTGKHAHTLECFVFQNAGSEKKSRFFCEEAQEK